MEKFRDRKFALLLYPEDATHMQALEIIKKSYDYAAILHDKDLDEKGETKKSHYHVIITTGSNAKWSTAIIKELGIADNYIEKIKNLDRALEYLIHLNDDNKHQYPIDSVEGTLRNRLNASMSASDKTEGEKVNDIADYIENSEKKISTMDMIRYASQNGMWDVLRRGGMLFIRALDEHNEHLEYERQEERKWTETFSRRTGEIYETPFDTTQGWS